MGQERRAKNGEGDENMKLEISGYLLVALSERAISAAYEIVVVLLHTAGTEKPLIYSLLKR